MNARRVSTCGAVRCERCMQSTTTLIPLFLLHTYPLRIQSCGIESLLAWRDYFLMNSSTGGSVGILALESGGNDELV